MKILSKLFGKKNSVRTKSKNITKTKYKKHSNGTVVPKDEFMFGDNCSTSTRRHRRKRRVNFF